VVMVVVSCLDYCCCKREKQRAYMYVYIYIYIFRNTCVVRVERRLYCVSCIVYRILILVYCNTMYKYEYLHSTRRSYFVGCSRRLFFGL
jgi:hypothetical protein